MTPERKRLLQCVLLVSVTMWFAGIWFWGFALLEVIARNERLHTNNVNSQCFIWLGGIGACLVSVAVIVYAVSYIPMEAKLHINNSTEATKICYPNRHTTLAVGADETYLSLETQGAGWWGIDTDAAVVNKTGMLTFYTAPLLFVSLDQSTSCVFEPILYAGCAVESGSTGCNWNSVTVANTTYIRRVTASSEIEPTSLTGFAKNATYIYEYNSPSHSQAVQFVINLNNSRKKFLSATLGYMLLLTGISAVIAVRRLNSTRPPDTSDTQPTGV